MNYKKIKQVVGEIFDKYKFEPKTNETRDKIKEEYDALLETLKGTNITIYIHLFTIETYAISGVLFYKGDGESRYRKKVDTFWIEDEIKYDTSNAYEDAMSLIEARK